MEKHNTRTIVGGARAEFIEVEPNVRLHITDAGTGRPVVLIPGWPMGDEMFEYQYNDLINNNFRVIGISLRGFGRSDKPFGKYDYDTHAADIHRILSHLGIRDAVLGGFSIGGAIAIRLAAYDRGVHISKLALFAAAAPAFTQRPDFPYNLPRGAVDQLIELSSTDRPQMVAEFIKIFSAQEDSLNLGIRNWLTNISLMASPYATAQCLATLRDSDLRQDLKKIMMPTLIMHGKKDHICSFELAEIQRAGITNSRLVTFENSGHSLFLEESLKFNTELIKFAVNND